MRFKFANTSSSGMEPCLHFWHLLHLHCRESGCCGRKRSHHHHQLLGQDDCQGEGLQRHQVAGGRGRRPHGQVLGRGKGVICPGHARSGHQESQHWPGDARPGQHQPDQQLQPVRRLEKRLWHHTPKTLLTDHKPGFERFYLFVASGFTMVRSQSAIFDKYI